MTDIFSFLEQLSQNSDFKANLSLRGGYITFSNSGKRGEAKFFQIGLDNILQTLKDIYDNISVFVNLKEYSEKPWRDNGSTFFKDPVANANSTVQTKPLFSTLSKVIIWANQPHLNNINPDKTICIDKECIEKTIALLEETAENFKPKRLKMHTPQNDSKQIIYFGAPGTGKSHEIKSQIKKHKSFRITFHPDTDYSSFVGAYKPTSVEVRMRDMAGHVIVEDGKEVKENKIIYTYVKQAFLNAYIEAWKEQAKETPQPVFLVIEEINRGNCAQIFGDIFQLLDRNSNGFSDYAIVPDADLSRHVKKDLEKLVIANKEAINAIYNECEEDMVDKLVNGQVLLLPNNLYIWATMNTSDQSLFPIDSAFKRRWDWKYIKIADAGKNWKINVCSETYDWWQFVQAINYFVFDATQSEDKNLGYFFAKAKDGVINAETFVSKVIFYLYTDVFKDYGFSGDIFKGTNGEEMTFQSFYNADGSVNEAQIKCFIENVIYSDTLPNALKVAESVEEQANESNGKKKLVIKFPDGTVIKETTQFASYLSALKQIGLDKAEKVASSKRYSRLNCPLVSKNQYDAILDNTQGFSYVNEGEYYIIKGIVVGTMNDFSNQISTELDLGIISSIETSAE